MSSDCYCTALRKASRRATSLYDEALAPVGVNLAQFSLLRNIDRAGQVSLTELARLTELDRSTIGRNARVLERMGLVKTAPGEDQREAVLKLDTKGHRVLRDGAPLWEQAQLRVESALSPQFAGLLQQLLQAV